jgi:hypothetical protein
LRARILAYGEEALDLAQLDFELGVLDVRVRQGGQLSSLLLLVVFFRKGTEPVSSEQERWMEAQVDVLKDKIQTVESDYKFRPFGTVDFLCKTEGRKELVSSLGHAWERDDEAKSLGPSPPSENSAGANGSSVAPSAPLSEGATPSASRELAAA